MNGRFFLEVDDHLKEINDITYYCLACHDGSVGPARQAQLAAGADQRSDCEGLPRYHPVEMVYPVGHPDFAPSEMLAEGMHIVNGRVTCVTCHSCEASDHVVVVDNRQSSLCLTCHRK